MISASWEIDNWSFYFESQWITRKREDPLAGDIAHAQYYNVSFSEKLMKCGCCGKEIGEIAFDTSYKMPDEIWNLSESEREERAQIGSDLCRLDERYFIRGVAYIPVIGTDKSYGWGIWAEVHQDDFFIYVESYNEDNSSKPIFPGKAANQIPVYEKMMSLELNVRLGNETQRPTFYFTDERHRLTKEQSEGITIEKVHGFSGT